MAGARKRAGPALKARTALLLVACFAVTPFCWLVGRDYLMLSGMTGISESQSRFLLSERMGESVRNMGATAFPSSVDDLTPACTTISTKDQKAAVEAQRALSQYRTLAMETLFQTAGRDQIEARFSKHEMIFLSACMQATPLASWCQRKVDMRTTDSDAWRQKREIKLGLLQPASNRGASEDTAYCDALPGIVLESAAP